MTKTQKKLKLSKWVWFRQIDGIVWYLSKMMGTGQGPH
jgi:hypothetical protein